MRRFFISPENISDNNAFITGSDVNHIKNVLRMKTGDEIEASDGMGNIYTSKLISVNEQEILLALSGSRRENESSLSLRLFQAVPKGNKFDLIVEKATELGVVEILPIITERSVTRLVDERGLKKLARWERIAAETCKQVGRIKPITIQKTMEFSSLTRSLRAFSLKIAAWELENEKSLKSVLHENSSSTDIDLFIGPEGGITLYEMDFLRNNGFISVSLGTRILKSETAAISSISNIIYQLE